MLLPDSFLICFLINLHQMDHADRGTLDTALPPPAGANKHAAAGWTGGANPVLKEVCPVSITISYCSLLFCSLWRLKESLRGSAGLSTLLSWAVCLSLDLKTASSTIASVPPPSCRAREHVSTGSQVCCCLAVPQWPVLAAFRFRRNHKHRGAPFRSSGCVGAPTSSPAAAARLPGMPCSCRRGTS